MMAHNRYRNELIEGNEERAEIYRQQRNKNQKKYETAKKEFLQTQKEERRIN